jgi:hypothetical protein
VSGEELPGHQVRDDADPLAGTTGTLASLAVAARSGDLDTPAALGSLTAVRRLATELEHAELALIEAARDSGATWSQIAAALGTRNRQTAQKRHVDLSRRSLRPPVAGAARAGAPAAVAPAREPESRLSEARDQKSTAADFRTSAGAEDVGRPPQTGQSAAAVRKRQAVPKITNAIIAEGRYELAKAPGHAETRAWLVLVGGQPAGLVRPTWRGERSRHGWEAVDNAGAALPATSIGRVTAGGNARTRDAAAVSLLHCLQRQHENERRRKAAP